MRKIKDRFMNDPVFASSLIIAGGIITAAVLKEIAKTITASAYAYRASKLK
jgi:hypothetical protein